MKDWKILYRGSLTSCNYSCSYCPFAKTANSVEELKRDEGQLNRFADWVEEQGNKTIRILITPWGEALGHAYYRRALVRLSRMPNVRRVSIQTNLSAPVCDLADARLDSLALWTTYHPGQTTLARFAAKSGALRQAGVRHSVGCVGLREHLDAIEALRGSIDPGVYVWVNAYKRWADYYSPEEERRLTSVDPYFHWNLQRHPSLGKPCAAGHTVFAVDGDGNARRCHFVPETIGNIYHGDFSECLKPRNCVARDCGCHIGYIHLRGLGLESLYADGLMERIPEIWPELDPAFARV